MSRNERVIANLDELQPLIDHESYKNGIIRRAVRGLFAGTLAVSTLAAIGLDGAAVYEIKKVYPHEEQKLIKDINGKMSRPELYPTLTDGVDYIASPAPTPTWHEPERYLPPKDQDARKAWEENLRRSHYLFDFYATHGYLPGHSHHHARHHPHHRRHH